MHIVGCVRIPPFPIKILVMKKYVFLHETINGSDAFLFSSHLSQKELIKRRSEVAMLLEIDFNEERDYVFITEVDGEFKPIDL